MGIKWSSNKVIALVLFVFSIFYLIMAFQIPSYVIPRPIDSDLFPKVLGVSMFVLSVFLFFEKTKKQDEIEDMEDETNEPELIEEEEKQEAAGRFKTPKAQVVVSIIGIALYIILFERLGFILSSVLFTFLMTFYFGYRRHVVNLMVAVSVSLTFYLLLTKALGVYLPTGWLPI